jgi:hypothetical protein
MRFLLKLRTDAVLGFGAWGVCLRWGHREVQMNCGLVVGRLSSFNAQDADKLPLAAPRHIQEIA